MKISIIDKKNPRCMICNKQQDIMIMIERDIDWSRDITRENNVMYICKWCFRQINVEGSRLL